MRAAQELKRLDCTCSDGVMVPATAGLRTNFATPSQETANLEAAR
jgi:hypothetical protein